MKLSILAAGYALPDTGAELASEREFRRSTRSILKGVVLLRRLFEKNPSLKELAEKKRLGFIVSSSVGEIEITRDFLKDFALSDTARPFLFQLSSHNSTVGFLAQYFALKGPTLTLSNGYQGTEAALETANLFLASGSCDAVIVFSVDQSIEEWVDLKMYKKNPQLKASSGASLLLISLKDEVVGLRAKAKLNDLVYSEASQNEVTPGDFYDSNMGELIAKNIESANFGEFQYIRPDSTTTRFSLYA
jgi:hypothetical protein